jgi:hypothetical protein
MRQAQGDMFSVLPLQPTFSGKNLFVVTTNGLVRYRALVMGAGIADTAARHFVGLRGAAARVIDPEDTRSDIPFSYGLMIVPAETVPGQGCDIGLFQTKRYPRDRSDLNLIKYATLLLSRLAPQYDQIHLAFPGIGLGRLTVEQVLPIIEELPDNVTVWTGGTNARA